MMQTDYLLRLIPHGVPKTSIILSSFLILSPLSEGRVSSLTNGENPSVLFARVAHRSDAFLPPQLIGQIVFVGCMCTAWALWSFSSVWIVVSLTMLYVGTMRRDSYLKFSVTYWSIVFLEWVYAQLAVQLGRVLNSSFYYYLGVVWSGKKFCCFHNFRVQISADDLSSILVIVLVLWVADCGLFLEC